MPKSILGTLSVGVGSATATPVPERSIRCVAFTTFPASSVIVIVALFAPTEAGLNATITVQLAPIAIAPLAQVPVRRNSVPLLSWIFEIVKGLVPPLLNVTVFVVLAVPIV